MEDFTIYDLFSKKQLQSIQNAFSNMTGLAALTTDTKGTPVTDGSNFTRYCMEYTRNSAIGCERCQKCDIMGAERTLKTGKPVAYVCHSGLVDFAAPIMVGDTLVGSFIGGQALIEEPNEDRIRRIAEELDIPFEPYWKAIKEVPVIPKDEIDEAANFLFEISEVLSELAHGKLQAIEAQKETERVANMKTDFLANMSHEIRTPMNAIIGMAEMALREQLPPAAVDYISQIKSSGTALLNIINDILDFSKIESGKMDIITEEYEFLSVIYDLSSILMTRLQDKDVELICTLNPTMPFGLVGDILRIRQIIINIANNAIKFTHHGYVWLDVDYEKVSEDQANILIAVHDTGIGIKKEDIGKLFESFQQVDSKRNRNIEGTGLGLAITARLLQLMDGSIRVSSVYGEGSTFSITIPQKITNWSPSIVVKKAASTAVFGYWRNVNGSANFYHELKRLGVDSYALPTLERFDTIKELNNKELLGKELYCFTSEDNYLNDMQDFVADHPEIQFIVVCDFSSTLKESLPNVRFIKKPFSTIGMAVALNNEEFFGHEAETFEFDFIAPDAKVMVVDDNEVNLIVAEGLLEPLKMTVVKANSGKRCLELLDTEEFDIVFMDHMMPEMDGVETTHIIRRLHPEFDEMPIIALTANAVGEAKKMFLAEGMNDFVAKPIELKQITAKIRQWLPKEKIVKASTISEKVSDSANNDTASKTPPSVLAAPANEKLVIGDLDIDSAVSMLGSEKLFMTILEKYYSVIDTKADLIKQFEQTDDIPSYTIEVHALKSASKQIGAMELSEKAAELEACGHNNDAATIHEKTAALLDKYLSYKDVLATVFGPTEAPAETEAVTSKGEATPDILENLFTRMLEAVDNLDMDEMEVVANEMDKYNYNGDAATLFANLKEAVSNIDVDSCTEIIEKWRAL